MYVFRHGTHYGTMMSVKTRPEYECYTYQEALKEFERVKKVYSKMVYVMHFACIDHPDGTREYLEVDGFDYKVNEVNNQENK